MTKRIISIVTAIMLMLQIMMVCPIELSAETPPQTTTYTGTGYTVEYTVKSSWDKTQNIGIKLNNTSDSPMSVWALKYNAHGEIRELYNGEVYKNEGTEYIIRSTSNNSSIEAGKSVEFGYSVTGENLSVPESIVLCSEQREANEAEYSVEFQLSEQWNPTYTAKIVLNNLSQFEMSGWSLSYDSNATVENIWNGKLISQNNGRITVSGSAENFTLTTGGTTEININGKVSYETPAAENFKLTYTYINADIEDDNNGEEKEDLVIFAFGNYDEETDNLEVSWYSNTEKGTYEVLKSEDNISYTTIASVTDTDSCSVAGTSLNNGTQYFKVKVTDESGRTAESIPFEVTKNENGVTSEYIDTDKDGLADYLEEILGTDPNKADTDNDELTDYDEIYITGTDPLKADTDGNGRLDSKEDPDNDGLNNIQEIGLKTDPLNPDTDGDGLTDGDEYNIYWTLPTKYDTDDDGIGDGDEIKIGLNPKNPKTYGMPDTEYTIPQEVTADSEAMSEINTEDNPYELSVEVKAAGNAENISVSESGYANAMHNDAILGIIPELSYDSNCKVDEVVVKFKLEEEALTEKTELSELKGIQRYQIFKFFEDDNMLLPIITEYNEATNTISATTDCLGTYCVMDMGNFLSGIAALENEETEEPTPMLMSLNAEAPKLTVKPQDEFNVVFLIDTRNKFSEMEFDWIKESLIESGRVILNRSENAKIYLIKQGPTGIDDGYTVLKNEAGENYFNDIEQLEEAINSLYRNGFLGCNLSDGIRYVYEEIDHSVPTFVFDIFHEEKVYYRESDGYDILNKVKEEPIDITLVSKITLDDPKGYAIDLSTLGASGIIGGYMFANAAVEHIYGDVPEIDSSYYMIVSTGLYRMQLKAPITKEYFDAANGELEDVSGLMDSDNDGLYDFEEINLKSGLVKLDRQGNVVYPTYYECTQAIDGAFYVDSGLESYKNYLEKLNQYVPNSYLDCLLYKTKVLPINSDPTDKDSDKDGILDIDEKWNGIDERYKDINPLKIDTLESLYCEFKYNKVINSPNNSSYVEINGNDIIMHLNVRFNDKSNNQALEKFESVEEDPEYVKSEYISIVESVGPNCTYKDIITDGIKRRWEGTYVGTEYDFYPGLEINVKFMIHEAKGIDTKKIKINIRDDIKDTPHMNYEYNWNLNRNHTIDLYVEDYRNDKKHDNYKYHFNLVEFEGVAAHEVGHAMGLLDAYACDSTNEFEPVSDLEITYKDRAVNRYYCLPPGGEIMNSNGKALCNDIEMVLQAMVDNSRQCFVPTSKYKLSKAIKQAHRYQKANNYEDVEFYWDGKKMVSFEKSDN